MKLNKTLIFGTFVLGLSLSSCVGDLDLNPIDPNLYNDTESESFYGEALGECYSIMAVSGQDGPGSSIISGLDNGRGQYTRAIFMMNEFTTDECVWVWKDDGIYDLVTCTYGASNGNIYGTYGRLYAHIAVCNQFINSIPENTDNSDLLEMRNEARALRAMSYYWALDIFGSPSFTLDTPDGETEPSQITRKNLYNWLENELIYLVDQSNLSSSPLYGRVGKDGAEALLARLYLNAEVYTGTAQWDKCAQRCSNIISRHENQSTYGGLVDNYLGLFAKNNNQFMPGGGGVNEILWGIAYDSTHTQTYGGTTFLIASQCSANLGMNFRRLGTSAAWTCLKARQNLSELFAPWNSKTGTISNGEGSLYSDDIRASQWIAGHVNFTDDNGNPAEGNIEIENNEIGSWSDGYTVVKWSNCDANSAQGSGLNYLTDPDMATEFATADLALIRLADVYLMYVESWYRQSTSALPSNALKYMNYIRNRAGVEPYTNVNQIGESEIINERGRELYWELTRRSDLIRFNMYTGNSYLWPWKGNVLEGTGISERYKLMPIPTNIIAAQPSFVQNPGW